MAVSVAVSTMAEIPLRNGGRGDGHWRWSGGRRAGRRLLSVCGVWAVGGGRWAPDDAGLGERRHSSVCGCGVWAVASEECARVRLLPAFLADI